jgi:cytoskeletal protein RodZ
MSIKSCLIRKSIAGFLATLLTAAFSEAAPVPLPQTMPSQSSQSAAQVQEKEPDSNSESIWKGANVTSTENLPASSPTTNAGAKQSANQDAQSIPSQPAAEEQQNGVNQPVGTAAAPLERSAGVAASKPAGAVIAPAKQRRARSFIIRLGVVAGACVAIGTVAVLSHASSSQPR